MEIKYIYSACIEVYCGGFRILTDPWFTEGVYDGTWYQFPKIDPYQHISKPDLIYISHIHPDHYDPGFLSELIRRFGDIKILIPDLEPNYLLFKGKSDGLDLIPTRHFKNEKVEIFIEENDTGSVSDIDSALIIRDISTGKLLLNLNDCIYNQAHVDILQSIIKNNGNKIDLLALGYTGAGPYPQTYIDSQTQKELLISEAEKKKYDFFERYKKYTKAFDAKYNLPFAGEYILGGKHSYLNDYRGVADAFEIKSIDEKAIVLDAGGRIDLETDTVENERNAPYDKQELDKRIDTIKNNKYDYEKEVLIPIDKINFLRLIKAAAVRAQKKSEIGHDYHFLFSVLDEKSEIKYRFDVSTKKSSVRQLATYDGITYDEFSEIKIDYRYFYGLLTTIYHWNNAEVGSQFFTNRYPLHNFNAKVQSYLNFFSIA